MLLNHIANINVRIYKQIHTKCFFYLFKVSVFVKGEEGLDQIWSVCICIVASGVASDTKVIECCGAIVTSFEKYGNLKATAALNEDVTERQGS